MSAAKSFTALSLAALALIAAPAGLGAAERVHIDPAQGSDGNPGTVQQPLRSLSAALAKLKEPVAESVVIELAPGTYSDTGSVGMPANCLHLTSRMRPGVEVRLIGRTGEAGRVPILDWKSEPMITATDGEWAIENVQVGSFQTSQREGLRVANNAHVTVKDATFRTRSNSGAAIHATRGGKVSLRGAIRINEHLHDKAEGETFAGIIADDRGLVMFAETDTASLDMGNGSLSANYYGVIRLGCKTAKVTSWGEQSNNIAINNGGRIDFHNSTVTLRARNRRNTPIGLEHDGHVLAEGARVIIEGDNDHAIVLQKVSSFTCNAVELRGTFQTAIESMSGSIFVGEFKSDVGPLTATTSGSIHVSSLGGLVKGPVSATKGGVISLPNKTYQSTK